MKGGDNMNTIIENTVVECVSNPKLFNGHAIVKTVGNNFVWCDWHYGFGMVAKKDLKLANDQTKVIYKK